MLAFDGASHAAVVGARTPFLDDLFRVATHAGDTWVQVVFVLLLVGVAYRADARLARAVGISAFVGLLPLLQGLKVLVDRGRPSVEAALIAQPWSASFPSGHAFGSALLVGLALWVANRMDVGTAVTRRLLAAAGVVMVVLVGVSRVYLGVHWASDVLAGWALAAVWLGATVVSTRRAGV